MLEVKRSVVLSFNPIFFQHADLLDFELNRVAILEMPAKLCAEVLTVALIWMIGYLISLIMCIAQASLLDRREIR